MAETVIPVWGRWAVMSVGNCKCHTLGLIFVGFWLFPWVLLWRGIFFPHFLSFVFVFSSDLDTDDDLNSDDYEYEDEAKLVIFPDHYEIALPNIEELPALVSECARLLARCTWLCVRCVCVWCVCMGRGGGWMREEGKNECEYKHTASLLWQGPPRVTFQHVGHIPTSPPTPSGVWRSLPLRLFSSRVGWSLIPVLQFVA